MLRTVMIVMALLAACGGPPAPKSPQATDHVSAGTRALADDDLDRAEAEFHMALEFEPNMPEALNGLGLVAMRRKDYPRAREMFRQAVLANDDFAEGHANLGAVLYETGDPAAALPHFRAALDIDPGYAPARHNLARALRRVGRFQEAREEYMKLTSVARTNADAWAELAHVELTLQNPAAAGRAARTALGFSPRHALARRVQASLLRDAGELGEALAAYDALVKESPSDAELLVDRSVTLLLLGRADEARRDAERAVAVAPKSAAAHFALGVVTGEMGDDESAVASFDRALALAAEGGRPYPQARYLMAAALGRLGRRKEALAAYDAFLAEAKDQPALGELVERARAEKKALESRPIPSP